MNKKIHPKYHQDTKVTCTCGETFTTGSTQPEIHVEICSKCHPFFTGEMRFVDTQGRVEKFEAQREKAKKIKSKTPPKKVELKETDQPQTLKEMLTKMRHQKTNQKQAAAKEASKKSS